MNLCSLSVVLCLFGSTAIGVIAGVDSGFLPAACGGVVGFAIGVASAFAVIALERASMPVKKKKHVWPFAIFSLAAIAAPIVSGGLSAFGAQKAVAALSRRVATEHQANKAPEPTPGSVTLRAFSR
jgi:hypothetical protein